MQDLALACIYSIGLLFLIVVVSSALVAEHTDARIPKVLLYGTSVRRAGRKSLMMTLPWIGVILGGGQFVGGRVSPIGAVIGALTMALAASPLLTFMRIQPDWQVAANGVILIIVLAARALVSRKET